MTSMLPVLVSAAPQLFQLWQGMDAPAQRQLLAVGKHFLPLAGLTDEVLEKVVAIMDEDSDLMTKVVKVTSDPVLVAAFQAKLEPKAEGTREICVSCPNCKQLKFIHV